MNMRYRGTDFRSDNRSNAEYDILGELQQRKLNIHFYTQYPYYFNLPRDVVPFTSIDYYWQHRIGIKQLTPVAMFLDGEQIHCRSRQQEKDIQIDEQLKWRGVIVKRFIYTPPITKTKCRGIVDQIEQVLKSNGY